MGDFWTMPIFFLIFSVIVILLSSGVFLLVFGTAIWAIYNNVVNGRKYEQEYERLLEKIKNNPEDRSLRLELRKVGKWLVAHLPQYTEQSLANDLAAVLGAQTGADVLKVEITNADKLNPLDVAEQVEKLGQLFLKGVITSEEFERGKAMFLGNPPDVAQQTMETLDDLYSLKQKGALSESEYNVKKWDLLSGKLIK